jgi:phenylalanyl-tRNA synthetase beta chain
VLPVELNAGAEAPRFVGRVIEGVDARCATPVWMAERLRRSGVRPVSFLVDVTQYVMLELGQPMHAFDRDLLQGPIGVRARAPAKR